MYERDETTHAVGRFRCDDYIRNNTAAAMMSSHAAMLFSGCRAERAPNQSEPLADAETSTLTLTLTDTEAAADAAA